MQPEISITVPVYDEGASLEELDTRLRETLDAREEPWELIYVDDGSRDEGAEWLVGAAHRQHTTVIRLRRNFGKGAALDAGFRRARGDILVTLDADLQDDPAEIPALLDRLDQGADLVVGERSPRRDPLTKRLPSALYNYLVRLTSGCPLSDVNCGLRAMRAEVYSEIRLWGENYRLLPVLAHGRGYRIEAVPVEHRPRPHGHSKYGLGRFGRGFMDIMTVLFLTRFDNRPSHFFGGAGLVLGGAGLGILVYITLLKLMTGTIQFRYPLLSLGVLLVIIGFQFIANGFLIELILRTRSEQRPTYSVAEVLDGDENAEASVNEG